MRLVVQHQLVLANGLAQVAFDQQPLRNAVVHFRFEKRPRIASGRFGPVHGQVGMTQQGFHVFVTAFVQHHTHAGRRPHGVPVQREGLGQLLDHFGGYQGGIAFVAQAAHHDHELVTTLPRHDVVGAQARLQTAGHGLEQQVAHAVPQAVVDVLEVVKIDKQHGHFVAVAARGIQCLAHLLRPMRPVGQPGERIVHSQFLQAFVAQRQLSCALNHQLLGLPGMPGLDNQEHPQHGDGQQADGECAPG